MSKFDISDNILKAISDGAIKVNPTEGRKIAEELLVLRGRVHLPAAPVEPKPEPVVEYWRHHNCFEMTCKTENRIIVETNGGQSMIKCPLPVVAWHSITAEAYESAKASGKVEPPAPKRIEPLSDRAKYTRHQAANLCWDKVNELCEAWNERVGVK